MSISFLQKQKTNPLKHNFMKVKGTILVGKSHPMRDMKEGEKGYLDWEAIVLADDNEIFIDTIMGVSPTKDGTHRLWIKRIGPGEDDFEIDITTISHFSNRKMTPKEKEELKSKGIIGPIMVDIEQYDPEDYRKQLYPRMDLSELIEELADVNDSLENNSSDNELLADKEELKRLVKKSLCELSSEELKRYKIIFSPVDKEGIINLNEDDDIEDFIENRINELEEGDILLDQIKGSLGGSDKEKNT